MRKIFYIGWIGFGNIGDDLMWDVFLECAKKIIVNQPITIVPSMPGVNLYDVAAYDVVVLGGGSLLIPGYVDVLYHALKQGKQVAIWGSGVDWLSKKDVLGLLSGETNKIQYKASPEHRRMLRKIFNHALFAGVRGPLTKLLMEQLDVEPERVVTSGDPGLLLKPDQLEPPINAQMWPSAMRVVGLNWGTSYNRIYGGNEETVENQVAEASKLWIQGGYKLYLNYVWGPDREALTRLADKIGRPDAVRIAPKVYSHQALMRIMRRCSFTVNFKLHANVMSAAAGVPFIALGYRMKTFDFMDSIGRAAYVISTDEVHITDKLVTLAGQIQGKWELERDQLNKKISIYKKTLSLPFLNNWN